MTPTQDQQAVIDWRAGDMLVAASAGSGKTETLTRRCVALLSDPRAPCNVDELLVLTFTRAAAAELRERIGGALRDRAGRASGDAEREHLARCAVLIDGANISTFDAWCARVVRDAFPASEQRIDPGFITLSASDAEILRQRQLERLFDWAAEAHEPLAERTRTWLKRNKHPSARWLQTMVAELHARLGNLVDPDRWRIRERRRLGQSEAALRTETERQWGTAIADECALQVEALTRVLPRVAGDPAIASKLRDYADLLNDCETRLREPETVWAALEALDEFRFGRAPGNCDAAIKALRNEVRDAWHGRRLRKKWASAELRELVAGLPDAAHLGLLLLDLEASFAERLWREKRRMASYEFVDVQRLALGLLGAPDDAGGLRPTPVAERLRGRYRYVLVDEFQDTSPVQVALLELVSRPRPGNRCMVGDLKQSIFGFREAEPKLFAAEWQRLKGRADAGEATARVQPLRDSFRTHAELLAPLNEIFAALFAPRLGGLAYDETQQLRAAREEMANATMADVPRVELHLLDDNARSADHTDDEQDDDEDDGFPLERIECEARVIAARIRRLHAQRVQIPTREGLRALRYSDVVVLLRAMTKHATLLASELRRCGIPALAAGREALLASREVQDVRAMLALIANRRQDVSLAAVLRGPLGGLDDAALLRVREFERGAAFHEAVLRYAADGPEKPTRRRVSAVLACVDGWQALARTAELPQVLQRVIHDADLLHFARALPGGEQRVAMLRSLQEFAAEFARRRNGGVAEFVAYLDALENAGSEPEVTLSVGADVVRVMSIHASKGLEFPVVFLAAAGNDLTRMRGRSNPIADADYGLGLRFYDHARRATIESPTFRTARLAEAQREQDEELRLLYVATTRARELLCVVGHHAADKLDAVRAESAPREALSLLHKLNAKSYLDWLLPAALSRGLIAEAGPIVLLSHADTPRDVDSQSSAAPPKDHEVAAPREPSAQDEEWARQLAALVTADASNPAAALPALISVSAVKSQALVAAGEGDVPLTPRRSIALRQPTFLADPEAADDGRALGDTVHRFLEHIQLRALTDRGELAREAERLVRRGPLTESEAASLPLDDIHWIADTDAGVVLRTARRVRREVGFTYGLAFPSTDERTLLRGVIDVVAERDGALTLLDYKTDLPKTDADWRARRAGYAAQLQLYALAAGALFDMQVTAAWLVFLRKRRCEQVDVSASALERLPDLLRCAAGRG